MNMYIHKLPFAHKEISLQQVDGGQGRESQGRAGQGRAGQARESQGRAEQDKTGPRNHVTTCRGYGDT